MNTDLPLSEEEGVKSIHPSSFTRRHLTKEQEKSLLRGMERKMIGVVEI